MFLREGGRGEEAICKQHAETISLVDRTNFKISAPGYYPPSLRMGAKQSKNSATHNCCYADAFSRRPRTRTTSRRPRLSMYFPDIQQSDLRGHPEPVS